MSSLPAAALPPRSIASLLGPPTWDLAKLKLSSFLTSKEYRLAAWPSHLGLDKTTAWLPPYLQGASPRCLALPSGTRKNYSSAPPLPTRSIPLQLSLPTWDSAKLQLGSFLTSKKHRLAAWPSRESPRCLALPTGTWPNCSLAPSVPPRSIALLLGLPTWDLTKQQLGSTFTTNEHRLAAWPSHLGLGQTAAWFLPYVQGASPRCLALSPGTRPNCSLDPSLPPRSIALLLGTPTWDLTKLQLGSAFSTKEHHLASWPYHLGLGQTAAWFLPYVQRASPCYLALPPGLGQTVAWLLPYLQGASPCCLALPPGIRPNCSLALPTGIRTNCSLALPPGTRPTYSLAPPLTLRSIALLLGPPTWDSAKQQLGSSLTSKEHRLAAWPSHLGLDLTAAWLLSYLQEASPHYFAHPPGTRPNCSLAPPLSPKSIASLLGPPTWDSAKLRLGSSLTPKEYRLAAWPSHLGLGQTAAWLLPYLQGAPPRCLAPTTWDSEKLQRGSSLTSK
ncbi:hypothetical protein Adt_35072 [Abeliophyllum distichum]|uniref:Uncharacterized protein n=1 Tax=Abeliophyllum distichum TaxID=126358 RepID=A0ABD1QDN6_9LAMI